MRIEVSQICREVLAQQPAESELAPALLRVCCRAYRNRSPEAALAVLQMVDRHAERFEMGRLEAVRELADAAAIIEMTSPLFNMGRGPRPGESLAALVAVVGPHRFGPAVRRAWRSYKSGPPPEVLDELVDREVAKAAPGKWGTLRRALRPVLTLRGIRLGL